MEKIGITVFLLFGLIMSNGKAEVRHSSFAQNFEQRSQKLEKVLVSSASAEIASQQILASSDFRFIVFQLQAMGRVLSSIHPDFIFLRSEFKKIEDAIGEHKKWAEIKNSEKQVKAAQDFANLLESEAWTGREGQFIQLKNKFGATVAKHNITEKKVIKYWRSELSKVSMTKYDFSQLEGKNGLHEFKRDLRWILLEMAVFPHVVGLDVEIENCPLQDEYVGYALETMDHKYARLVSADQGGSSVAVSACLVSTLAHVVEDIDDLKTDSEKFLKDHADNRVPKDIKENALKTYKLFKKSKAVDFLIETLK